MIVSMYMVFLAYLEGIETRNFPIEDQIERDKFKNKRIEFY